MQLASIVNQVDDPRYLKAALDILEGDEVLRSVSYLATAKIEPGTPSQLKKLRRQVLKAYQECPDEEAKIEAVYVMAGLNLGRLKDLDYYLKKLGRFLKSKGELVLAGLAYVYGLAKAIATKAPNKAKTIAKKLAAAVPSIINKIRRKSTARAKTKSKKTNYKSAFKKIAAKLKQFAKGPLKWVIIIMCYLLAALLVAGVSLGTGHFIALLASGIAPVTSTMIAAFAITAAANVLLAVGAVTLAEKLRREAS